MQIVVVAGFVIMMAFGEAMSGTAPLLGGQAMAASAAAYPAGALLLSWLHVRLALRRLARASWASDRPARWLGLLSLLAQGYILAGLAGLMLLGWGQWVGLALRLEGVPLAGELAAGSPFVLALLAHWWAMYPLDQALRLRHRAELAYANQVVLSVWRRRQYIDFNVRHNLLFVAVPACMIILAMDVLRLFEQQIPAALAGLGALCLSAGIFITAPAMIVRIWRTRPLEDGPVRRRLAELSRRMALRFRQLLVWDTGGVIVNAGVMGLIGPVRYVLLSDALLRQMDEESIEAVFAHEAGHVVFHHILHMVVFTAGLSLVSTALGELTFRQLHVQQEAWRYAILAATAAAWLWLFGRISRLLERQADVFSACLVGTMVGDKNGQAQPAGPLPPAQESRTDWRQAELTSAGVAIFNRALLAVARLNGIALEQPNFRHGSILSRTQFLTELLASGRGRQAVDRAVGRVKRACWVMLAAGALAVGAMEWAG